MTASSTAYPTSRSRTRRPGSNVIGMSLKSSTVRTIMLVSSDTWLSPKYAVPGDTIMFPRSRALTTSTADSLRDSRSFGRR